jgi:hypothetical protein
MRTQGGASRTTRMRRLLLAASILSLIACGGSPPAEPAAEPARIELDVFSGRPNPTWDLTRDQAAELARLHATLSQASSANVIPDGLGYRGFKLHGFRSFEELIVWREVVASRQPDHSVQWNDPNRTLESFLLGTLQPHIDAETFRTLGSLISSP